MNDSHARTPRKTLYGRFARSMVFVASACCCIAQARADDAFYVDPQSNPMTWVRSHSDDPRAAKIGTSIAAMPMARWFGNWSGDVRAAVDRFVDAADAAHQVPILVAYDIPDRDCGGASAGGASDAFAYRAWIEAFSRGIGSRKALVVVEPDSTAQLDCFKTTEQRDERIGLLRYAVSQLRLNAPAADVYLDGGNAHWIAPAVMAARLDAAGLSEARGFALNVSNFYTTAESAAYAEALNAALMTQFGYARHVVIDSSRNGNGSNGAWCNPPNRKIGAPSGVVSDPVLAVWIKVPGDSDGACGAAPSTPAGKFSPDLAVELIDGNGN